MILLSNYDLCLPCSASLTAVVLELGRQFSSVKKYIQKKPDILFFSYDWGNIFYRIFIRLHKVLCNME